MVVAGIVLRSSLIVIALLYFPLQLQLTPHGKKKRELSSQHQTPWKSTPRSYCQKHGLTTPLEVDRNYGFGMSQQECKNRCRDLPECRFYTYGTWTKGMSEMLGGHYGQKRCQIYADCEVGEFPEMSLFEKPQDIDDEPKLTMMQGMIETISQLSSRLHVPTLLVGIALSFINVLVAAFGSFEYISLVASLVTGLVLVVVVAGRALAKTNPSFYVLHVANCLALWVLTALPADESQVPKTEDKPLFPGPPRSTQDKPLFPGNQRSPRDKVTGSEDTLDPPSPRDKVTGSVDTNKAPPTRSAKVDGEDEDSDDGTRPAEKKIIDLTEFRQDSKGDLTTPASDMPAPEAADADSTTRKRVPARVAAAGFSKQETTEFEDLTTVAD